MEGTGLVTMTNKERAKQFLPFDSMKGLSEALRKREEQHQRVERHEVDEETQKKVSDILIQLEKGMKVWVSHYANHHDVESKGTVTMIDKIYRVMCIGEARIYFSNIYDMEIMDSADN